MAADLRICDIFNRFYSELCQKSKLPDSGKCSFDAVNQNYFLRAMKNYKRIYSFFVCVCVTFATVLGKIYELLGVLAEVHPSEMVNNSDKLYKAYLGELKEQVCFTHNLVLTCKRRRQNYDLLCVEPTVWAAEKTI